MIVGLRLVGDSMMVLLLGIDEAGRGPIIGPMIMCGVVINMDEHATLRELGVKDSKMLSKKKREELYESLQGMFTHRIVEVLPEEIDRAVKGENGLNLNLLEAEKTISLIDHFKPREVVIDAPSRNLASYKEYISSRLAHKDVKLIVEHKADMAHPVVAAASIIAKVVRDSRVEDIRARVGIDFGSGYLSDPKTERFLRDFHETHAEHFRKSWAPYKKLAEDKKQKTLSVF